ncbi:MAG: 1,6-anhydro-N-acetylmuramyl-L-alanine amidase AmpD, partial [Xanthomonadaceae bacterium]|nr:1,6-anhydro-N-acetylmuramyl-L-alanine amidase AmpD [Xanthomonadaceae bacterium]
VPENKRAWHAGISSFAGRDNCNDFSLGVELEGDDFQPFTAVQYERLNRLLVGIRRRHPQVTRERIVGHADIAPGRKTDPGPFFDWDKVVS